MDEKLFKAGGLDISGMDAWSICLHL